MKVASNAYIFAKIVTFIARMNKHRFKSFLGSFFSYHIKILNPILVDHCATLKEQPTLPFMEN